MIGHLGPRDRASLWALLAERLAPGAPAVLNLQPPAGAVAVPDTRFCAIPIGRRACEGWGRAEPRDPDSVTWHMRYRVLDGETLISERAVDYQWWILTENQLHIELNDHGLTARPAGLPEVRQACTPSRIRPTADGGC